MKYTFFVIFLIFTVLIYANDGGIAIVGGALHPVNITTVSMDYERLNITCKETYFEIEAYIELFNHESNIAEPLLGFEFHEGALSNHGNFKIEENFIQYIIIVNNKPQIFEYRVRDQDTPGAIHTLVFEPKLIPGKNTVYHKFHLPYGFGSATGAVDYILETSSRWKDGIIKNLEIFIRTEFNTILQFEQRRSVDYEISKKVLSFDTIGESKLYDKYTYDIGGGHGSMDYEKYSLTQNGYLYKHIENFIPDKNISFQQLEFNGMEMYFYYYDPPYEWPRENSYITIHDWKQYIEDNNFRRYRWGKTWIPSEKMLEDLSIIELRILRNTLYAIRGYVFNNNFLNDYFNKQYWYFPNQNITMDDIVLNNAEQKILEYIIKEENKRRL
jgi:hypothetical protein